MVEPTKTAPVKTRMYGFRDREGRQPEFRALARHFGYLNFSEMLRDLVRQKVEEKAAAERQANDEPERATDEVQRSRRRPRHI
jgi:hypothetical protein